tara:strand:+ start:1698 stop:2678 length:981 start_codon:yes stop_codon:yes gene_type:complete
LEILKIKDQSFAFGEMDDWKKYRNNYINSWQSAFQRRGVESSLDWMIGHKINKTYLLINSDDEIVSAYSLLKNNVSYSSGIASIGLCNNVFCSRKYLRYNLFQIISKLSLDKSSNEFELAYGMPNKLAVRGHKRVGWQFKELNISLLNIEDVHKKYDNSNVKVVEFSSMTTKEKLDFFNKSSLIAIEKSNNNGIYSTYKSFDYYQWRFLNKPHLEDREYFTLQSSKSTLIFSFYKPDPQINILDFQWKDIDSFLDLLLSLIQFTIDHNLTEIRFLNSELKDMMNHLGLINNVRDAGTIPLILYPFKNTIDLTKLAPTISFSDYDVY